MLLPDIKKEGELCSLLTKDVFCLSLSSSTEPTMFISTSYDSGDGKSDTVSTSGTKWKGKKTYIHLDFHMFCSQEANIIPWMLVIKQCDMDNCYALSLFRQVFFLLNKPLKGLKYNHSQLSTHNFFPSIRVWTIPYNWSLFLSQSESLSTGPGDRV